MSGVLWARTGIYYLPNWDSDLKPQGGWCHACFDAYGLREPANTEFAVNFVCNKLQINIISLQIDILIFDNLQIWKLLNNFTRMVLTKNIQLILII